MCSPETVPALASLFLLMQVQWQPHWTQVFSGLPLPSHLEHRPLVQPHQVLPGSASLFAPFLQLRYSLHPSAGCGCPLLPDANSISPRSLCCPGSHLLMPTQNHLSDLVCEPTGQDCRYLQRQVLVLSSAPRWCCVHSGHSVDPSRACQGFPTVERTVSR